MNNDVRKIGAWFGDISNLAALIAIATVIVGLSQNSKLVIIAAFGVLTLIIFLKYADLARFKDKLESLEDIPALGLAKGSVRAFLAFGFLIGFGLFIYYTLSSEDTSNMAIFTALCTIISAVVGFYFGSKTAMAAQTVASQAAPEIIAIEPGKGKVGSDVKITNLSGNGFRSGASVYLVLGTDKIFAENVTVIQPTKIKCMFKLLKTAKPGKWDVVVTNPDGQQGILDDGFEVKA